MHKFSEKYFFTYKFLNDCLPIYALYAILFKEEGLSIAQISLLFSFWSFIVVITEVPSGILADRWNRKYMLFIATVLKAICFITWSFSNTFFTFALGFLFWGLSESFSSGTEEGLLYDNLKNENRESDFGIIYGRGRFYSSLGTIIGVVSGGILAYFISISTLSIISAVIMVINLFFVSKIKEKNYYSERLKDEHASFFKTLSGAVNIGFKNYKILIGMILLVLVIGVSSYLDEFDPLVVSDFGLGYFWVSIIFAVRFIFTAIGNRYASKIDEKIISKNNVFIFSALGGVLILVFSVIWNQYALLIFGLYCMVMTMAEVIQIDVIQKQIGEEGRTTVMSLISLFQNIAMIVFCSIFALLSNGYSLRICFILISLYGIAGLAIVFFIKKFVIRHDNSLH